MIRNLIYLGLCFAFFTSCSYAAIHFAERDAYCIQMPRQDLDIARDGMKQMGDKNE